ncbi:MAG: response regulator transcription factor [Coprococcus sp.]|nr:response regulator transcription factor [Coprococcus sp.]
MMADGKILIIEDETDINNLIKEALTNAGYSCIQAFSGTEGLLLFDHGGISLVVLDLMLPGMTGEQVLLKIKEQMPVPVIILSARESVESKISLLESGADDYVTKPFDIKELIARIAVQLRKSPLSGVKKSSEITYKDIVLDMDSYNLTVAGQVVALTKQEIKIMELFMLHPDKVYSKQDIYDYAWNEYYMGEDKTINVHISNIRKKLKAFSDTDYIDTVWGIGFKLKK